MKKKIYWLISHLQKAGGVEIVSGSIIDILKDTFDITVVYLSDDKPNYDIFPEFKSVKSISLNIPHKVVRNEDYLTSKNIFTKVITGFRVFYFTFFGKYKYRRKIKKITTKDDIIVSCQLNSFLIAPKGRTNIFHLHYSFEFFESFYNRMIFAISTKPDSFLCLCKTSMDQMLKKYPNKKCHFIYNPCRISALDNFDVSNKHIVFFARLETQKNPLLAIETMRLIANKDKEVKLDIYGKGYLQSKIEEKIKEYHLENNVTLKGYGKPNVLKDYSLLLLTSIYEGVPLTIVEANFQSTPVITTSFGDSTPEIVNDGKNGYIIPQNDPQLIADRILALLNNNDELKSLRKSSFEFSKKFDSSYIKKKWIEYIGSFN